MHVGLKAISWHGNPDKLVIRKASGQLSITMGDGWRKQLIPMRKEEKQDKRGKGGGESLKMPQVNFCLSARIKIKTRQAKEFRENTMKSG